MTKEKRQQLREVAREAVNGTIDRLPAGRRAAWAADWALQTSNSFRRIGTSHGDGDVLCGTKHPIDGHPDLLAAPGVLAYVVAAQPSVVLALLDELDRSEDTLRLSRNQHEQDHAALEDKLAAAKVQCDRIADVEARLEIVAGTITTLGEAFAQLTSLAPGDVAKARVLMDQIMTTLRGAQR